MGGTKKPQYQGKVSILHCEVSGATYEKSHYFKGDYFNHLFIILF